MTTKKGKFGDGIKISYKTQLGISRLPEPNFDVITWTKMFLCLLSSWFIVAWQRQVCILTNFLALSARLQGCPFCLLICGCKHLCKLMLLMLLCWFVVICCTSTWNALIFVLRCGPADRAPVRPKATLNHSCEIFFLALMTSISPKQTLHYKPTKINKPWTSLLWPSKWLPFLAPCCAESWAWQPFKIPLHVREMIENREMENTLERPTFDMSDAEHVKAYPDFWKNLLWVKELQAYEDIKLFDNSPKTLIH